MNLSQNKIGMRLAKVALVLVVLCFSCAVVFSQEKEEKKEEKKEIKYLGSSMCVNCHKKLDNGPAEWEKSAHAKAFEALASEEAVKISEKAQENEKCLKCHVTGLGKPGGYSKELDEKKRKNVTGVTCEVCHGPGQEYMKVMMKSDEYDAKKAEEAGLVSKPTEKKCLECHNEDSPTFEKFDFKEMLAKIKHGVKLEDLEKEAEEAKKE